MDLPMEKDHFDIDVLPIFVEKVLQEMRHGLVRYMTAHHNMSGGYNRRMVDWGKEEYIRFLEFEGGWTSNATICLKSRVECTEALYMCGICRCIE